MPKKKESIQDEVIRMLQLSEFRNKNITKPTPVIKSEKKILKEDFIEDLEMAFSQDDYIDKNLLQTNVGNNSELTDEMKAAMLCHNMTEMEAILLGLYEKYNPDYFNKTIPAKANQDDTTLFTKKPSTKVRGELNKDDLDRFKSTQGRDIEKSRMPVTFLDSNQETEGLLAKKVASLKKWWANKDINMISYNMGSGKLTDLGKAQLQFLARAATLKPEGDFEKTLFDLFGTADRGRYHFKQTAQRVLREFYSLVCIPYITELTHRAKYNPNDMQLVMFIENALEQVIGAMDTKYDALKGNIGTFIITGVKNNVKNQLRSISKQKLDERETATILYNHEGPIMIKSTANPNEVEGIYDDVKVLKIKTNSGKQVYGYTYNTPANALTDFMNDARAGTGKPSPLSKRFLIGDELRKYYKSYPPGNYEDIADALDYKENNPTDEYDKISSVPVKSLPQVAKSTIYEILNQIANVMIDDVGKTQKYKRDGDGNIIRDKDGNPELVKANLPYDDEKPDYFYINKNILPILKRNKSTFIELMYSLLGFGEMINVYTKSWVYLNKNGKPTVRSAGDAVVYETINNVKTPVKNTEGKLPTKNDITRVWSTGSLAEEEVKQKFLQNFLANVMKNPNADKNRELIDALAQNPEDANKIVTATLNGLRKFFGFEGMNVPTLKKNIDKLNLIIQNYESSLLAENKARLLIKNLLNKTIKGNL